MVSEQLRALTLLKEGKHTEALQSLDCGVGSADSTVVAELANILLRLGAFGTAAALIKKNASVGTWSREHRYILGVALLEAGDNFKALQFLQETVTHHPSSIVAASNLVKALIGARKWDRASEAVRSLRSLNGGKKSWLTLAGRIAQGQGYYSKAREIFDVALEIDEIRAEAFCCKGQLYTELGDLLSAKDQFERAIQEDPSSVRSHLSLGHALSDSGEQLKALKQYFKALGTQPLNEEARYYCGRILRVRRRHRESQKYFKNNPFQDSLAYAAEATYLSGDLSEYEASAQKYLELDGRGHAVLGATELHARWVHGLRLATLFCSDPMQKVHHGVLSFGDQLPSEYERYKASTEMDFRGQGLVVNGKQSYGNFFANQHPFVEKIRDAIEAEISTYRKRLGDSCGPYGENFPASTSYSIKGWVIELSSEGRLKPHNHDRGWVSGTVYIQMPRTRVGDEGNLAFTVGGGLFAEAPGSAPRKVQKVEQGSIVLFPSSLFHQVIPFKDSSHRICIAFDVNPI